MIHAHLKIAQQPIFRISLLYSQKRNRKTVRIIDLPVHALQTNQSNRDGIGRILPSSDLVRCSVHTQPRRKPNVTSNLLIHRHLSTGNGLC